MPFLKVDGLAVSYVGPGTDDQKAAAIRANAPVPPDVPLYYFEITVVNQGSQGFIGVGFCTEGVNLARLPGWEAHSYGYHGDDGCAFSGSGHGRQYGPRFTTGDTVGALFDRAARTITFFKNGVQLDAAFSGLPADARLFPVVGMRTPGEEVSVNFGASPFVSDVGALKEELVARVEAEVARTPLPAPPGVLLPPLILEYLLQSRYWRTAAVLVRDVPGAAAALPAAGGGRGAAGSRAQGQQQQQGSSDAGGGRAAMEASPPLKAAASDTGGSGGSGEAADAMDVERSGAGAGASISGGNGSGSSAHEAGGKAVAAAAAAPPLGAGRGQLPAAVLAAVHARQRIYDDVIAGRPGEALPAAEALAGGSEALAALAPRLPFRLKVQQFIELVRASSGASAGVEAALAYGRRELGPYCSKRPEDEELLSDALSLLAYADPAASPCGHLLRSCAREGLAEELNSVLVAATGGALVPALERALRVAAAALGELKRADDPRAVVLDFAHVARQGLSAAAASGGGGGGAAGAGAGGGGVCDMAVS